MMISLETEEQLPMTFDGPEYKPEIDNARLSSQYNRIFSLMRDGKFRTLTEIEDTTGDPSSSISAQLRHMRKGRFGSHVINRRVCGERLRGLFEYQLIEKVSA